MHEVIINGINYTLADIEKDCWVRLLNGSLRAKDALHNPTIANVNSHGVNMRTVVLRQVNTATKQLAFHTDIRSGKCAEIVSNPMVSWHFYDAAGRVQIRAAGTASLHTNDAIADAAWAKSTANSRKIYMGEIAPSLISPTPTSGLPAAFESTDPTLEESEAGRKNFAIIITKIHWLEWLWLNSGGHRRASFNYENGGLVGGNWLVP